MKAIKIAPDNAAAHFNLGLLKAEQNRVKEAEKELREAFRLDPKMAPAAYNLCILTAKDRPAEALSWCRKAVELNPQEPKYAYTLAFYQKEQRDLKNAAATLTGSSGPAARLHGWLSFAGRDLRATRRSPPGRGDAPPGSTGGEPLAPGPGPDSGSAAKLNDLATFRG